MKIIKTALLVSAVLATGIASAATLPNGEKVPNIRPGECYAKVPLAAVKQETLRRPGYTLVEVDLGDYDEIYDGAAGQVREMAYPATAHLEAFDEVVSPAVTKTRNIVGGTRTVTQRELVKPAKTVWKRDKTGNIICLELVEAAEYKTVTKEITITPRVVKTTTAAVTKTGLRTVIDDPEEVREATVVGHYLRYQPYRETRTYVAPEFDTVDVGSRYVWRTVLCDINASPAKVRQIQQALRDRGFNPGKIDGEFDNDLVAALNRFRQSEGLPVSNFVTFDALRTLGVASR